MLSMHPPRSSSACCGCLLLLSLCLSTVLAHNEPHALSLINSRAITVQPDASVSISVTPTSVDDDGYVTVSFSAPSPSKLDFVAAYSPPDVSVTETAPIKYQYASHDPTYLKTGSGSLRFRLVNMRSDYVFVFFRNGREHPVLAARSNVVVMQQHNAPLKPRLLLTDTAGQLRLMWSSAESSHPTAMWGTSKGGPYPHTAPATSTTYSRGDMCGPPANTTGWREPGMVNTALLTDLEAGTPYYYTFGDAGSTSPEFSFVGPKPPSASASLHLVAFGDMGQSAADDSLQHSWEAPSINTTDFIEADMAAGFQFDALFHIGDISYARGYEAEWDQFFNQITPIASHMPYMVCLGNHERDYPDSGSVYQGTDSGGECGVSMETLFQTPRAARDKPWYSIELGPLHATFMSTENDFSVGSPQWQFLKADLEGVDRSVTPWVIFAGHRPMYIDSTNNSPPAGDQPVARALRAAVEPLLVQNKVDLAIWGHHHSYQRTCAVDATVCKAHSQDGVFRGAYVAPVHMVIGMAGQGLSQNIEDTPPKYTEYVDDQHYGYTRIHVYNATTLQVEFLVDHKLSDTMIIDRQ